LILRAPTHARTIFLVKEIIKMHGLQIKFRHY
jgi:hypothetical protein